MLILNVDVAKTNTYDTTRRWNFGTFRTTRWQFPGPSSAFEKWHERGEHERGISPLIRGGGVRGIATFRTPLDAFKLHLECVVWLNISVVYMSIIEEIRCSTSFCRLLFRV